MAIDVDKGRNIMALIHCNFFSEVLQISTSMDIILPQSTQNQIGMEGKVLNKLHPTLYLLHGLSDDHTIWQRRTCIERYVASLGLAVVMPEVNRSFYCDMDKGYKYWTFISEELPSVAREFFHLSSKREDNFVAGLSMGGYGAMKLGLRYPDKFAAVGSLSGALDIKRIFKEEDYEDIKIIFDADKGVKETEDDLFNLIEKISISKEQKPMLYQCCGTEDFLYKDNLRFKKHCEKFGIKLIYEEEAGTHEWGYWDKKIQSFLEKLPLKR
jgi:putative tributyrin esterase